MAVAPARLQAGDVLAFSAGSSFPVRLKFRKLDRAPRAAQRIAAYGRLVPEVGAILGDGLPAVISAYPAPTGPFADAIFVDSYLRPEVVSAGLELFATHGCPTVVIAQPLVAAHLILHHVGRPLPESLILVLGGYHCPSSLETFLRAILFARARRVVCVHAYGIAEVGAGLLIGQRVYPEGEVTYTSTHPRVTPLIAEGGLRFRVEPGSAEFETGDSAVAAADNRIIVRNPASRLSRRTLAELEEWTSIDWRRRTGHVTWEPELQMQLRAEVRDARRHEVPFGPFVGLTGMSWLDKPQWGEGPYRPSLDVAATAG